MSWSASLPKISKEFGSDLRQVIRVGTITVEVEDATTGDLSTHGIGGFRRNWWLVDAPASRLYPEGRLDD